MKTIFRILGKDLKKIIKNPAAIVVVLGICFIPSLYAWITLKANWDPYVNTGNVPIAIVNEDKGTIVNDKILNVGDQIVAELKNNHDVGWKFTTQEQGSEGLKNGEYYAMIVIPTNFSKDLATLSTATPIKPTLTYTVNDKTNTIATKITGVAEDKLTEQISQNFVKVINEQTLQLANQLGEKIKSNEPALAQLKVTMDAADQRLKEINSSISDSTASADSLASYLSTMKNDLPQITNQINSLQSVVAASKSLISTTQNSVNSIASEISNNTPNITNLDNQLSGLVSQLKAVGENASDNKAQIEIIDNANATANKLLASINQNISVLENLNNIFHSQVIAANIEKLNNVKGMIQTEQAKLANIKELLSAAKPSVDEINSKLDGLKSASTGLVNNVNSLTSSLYSNVIPTINTLSGNLSQGMNNADALLESSKSIVPQLQSLANFGISTSDMTVQQANELKNKLNSFKGTLNQLQDKANGVSTQSLDEMVNLLSKNPQSISSFLSSPITVKQEQVYGDLAFGAGLMPFYTALAIWVGALLLTSLFTVEAKNFEGEKANLLQKHFGKLLLFMILSLIQTTIIVLGDKFVLGFNPYNMWLMMGIGWLCSVTFTIIIFTLVSLFGNFGKALCVVIMVFQIAGSGAIYPIQTNPLIFRQLEFLWPFKYALDGFREAIAGPIWSMVAYDVKALLIFAGIFLAMGLLKPLVHKSTEFMEEKFKETGL